MTELTPTATGKLGPDPGSGRGQLAQLLRRIVDGREVWAIVDQALVSGTNFLTSVIVARYLGISEFGVFALAWMAVLFFASMQMSSIISPMMSLAPKTAGQDHPKYFGAVILQAVVFVTASGILLFLGVQVFAEVKHQPAIAKLALPLCTAMIAYMLQDFLRRYLFVTRQALRALVNDAVSCLPQLPLLFFFARAHWILTPGVLWFVGVTSLMGVALGVYWFEPVVFDWVAMWATLKRHWNISRWLAPSQFLFWTSTNFFFLVAPAYYGARAAGVLRSSFNILALANVWFLAMDNVVPAETARLLHEQGIVKSMRYLRQVTLRLGLLTVVYIGFLCAAPDFWLHLIYGSKYATYGYVLRLYGIVFVLTFAGKIVGAALQALEYTSPLFWSYLLMTAFSLGAAIPFTKELGMTGVILGTVANQTISLSVLFVALSQRVHHVKRNPKSQYSFS